MVKALHLSCGRYSPRTVGTPSGVGRQGASVNERRVDHKQPRKECPGVGSGRNQKRFRSNNEGVNMEHTATPWLQHPDYPTCLTTQADPTMSLLTVDQDGYGAFLKAEDCAFAVRACNAHDDLVKAVRSLVAMTFDEAIAAADDGKSLLYCRHDVLNPCWDNRKTDVPGMHWSGLGAACPECNLRAALAKAQVQA